MKLESKYLLATGIAVALIGAPVAIGAGENRPTNGGARNPAGGASQNYTAETQIIANNATYGTRQSNKSATGGGAIYGCRAATGAGNRPCVRAANLSSGRAFEFSTGGTEVGRIESTNPSAAPFTTNATAVATGLNADKVDGKDATQIVTDAQALNRIGQVSAGGTLTNARGITSATNTGAGTYTVVFAADASACAVNATVVDAANAGTVSLAPVNATTYTVTTSTLAAGVPANRAFHITAVC